MLFALFEKEQLFILKMINTYSLNAAIEEVCYVLCIILLMRDQYAT